MYRLLNAYRSFFGTKHTYYTVDTFFFFCITCDLVSEHEYPSWFHIKKKKKSGL
ncbi:hypothetical protein CROQUDRAFT_258928 [Cronartium quercuum f. sp. fusiforme G11]|uniref:Uncharacterized protein n=1 Tax=Cronartium quercuum f. sp. fusiforme G11 TaxID=708437 RepID=A0A9P6NDU3_9BASI|nr:hypothetical protein CROQUDRAFT_258928 [Cronartium quercuum f. sp. fusiforme G11]